MVRQSSVSEAYTLLGLEQGASMEQVRTTYKQLALRTHPDKNQGNAEATAQFQQVSEAYAVLQSHHSPSEPLSYYPCGHMHESDDDYDYYFDDYDYYYDDEDYDSDDDRLRFFMYIFEEVFRGRTGRGYTRTQGPYRPHSQNAPESREEYDARLKRAREEQEQAEARREQEKAERKAFEAQMREKERKEAGERQRAKATVRKAEAKNQRKRAAETAQLQQKRVQTLRSDAFAAARAGDASKVKKGVWEDEVDPAGGEIKMGCENYVAVQPEDPMETLLHIAARSGDADLVEWLDAHSADPEERNSIGLTAFHVALQHGHIQILKHFFELYDPKEEDHDAIYNLAPPKSLLSLALDSAEPEVVWIILDRGLATTQDIGNAWTEVTSLEGKQALMKKMGKYSGDYTEIQNLLMCYRGFTPPPTPKGSTEESSPSSDSNEPQGLHPGSPEDFRSQRTRPKVNMHRTTQSERSLSEIAVPMRNGLTDPSWRPPENGKARGRGRGRGRGHSRGRGRNPTN